MFLSFMFLSFTAAASPAALKSMRAKTREIGFSARPDKCLEDIAKECNPILRGWISYYGRYNPSSLYSVKTGGVNVYRSITLRT